MGCKNTPLESWDFVTVNPGCFFGKKVSANYDQASMVRLYVFLFWCSPVYGACEVFKTAKWNYRTYIR
jgi:hypothetical protein